MPACPTCQHELGDDLPEGHVCPGCGALVRQLPRRTVADVRSFAGASPSSRTIGEATIELSDVEGRSIDLQTLASLELSGEAGGQDDSRPRTVAFNAEQTVQFLGGSSAVDDSLLTSQWQDSVPRGGTAHPGVTLRQKETLSGSFISSSSLIVKSRNVRPSGTVSLPSVTPADAPDYELLNVIGEGGMGVVYAARQSSIARTVAVKMLKGEEGQNAAQRDKFISEAVVTGELDHPNIVPIYDLGANNDGALFYSMKRVKGTPWNKVLKERSLDENLTILLRVADAVAFAHVNGVIHRDLKPENVMLGDFGEVLVMDWGLARVSPEFPNADSVSQSDAMGGTPAYMAPEMATGPLEKISVASDVYLLGAILYEIITGRPPHAGKSVMACLFAAARNKIEPADYQGELLDVALRAMATDPADRYESVPAFQQAVRSYQAHAQSIRLVDHAQRHLSQAEERQDYELYARALYGLEESLTLWPDNGRAASLLAAARLSYARQALANADFDLGASLLDPADEGHRELLSQLEAGRRERESRQRRIRLLKTAVAALVVAVIGVVSVAYAAVRQQRDEAVTQRGIAQREERKARQSEKNAVFQRSVAEGQRKLAEENREKAVAARTQAEEERKNAVAARRAAEKAKAAEEYAAYVARIGLAKAKIDENAFDRAAELLEQCPPELRDWEWGRLSYLCNLSDRTWANASPIDGAELSPDGVHFATGDWDGRAAIWNLQTGQREHELSQGQYVHAVAYDATGERLAAGSSDGSVHVYRAADGELIAKLDGHSDGVLSVRFSPDGRWLLSSGHDYTARLWDIDAGRTLQVLDGHSWSVWAAEFSPDGQSIVTAGQDGKAIVWRRIVEPAEGEEGKLFKETSTFARHRRGAVYVAKFSPDGRRVATGGEDGRVLIWNPEKVQSIDIEAKLNGLPEPPADYMELAGHRGPVRALAFSPDGAALASGAQDNAIVIWDLASGAAWKTLRGHSSHVRSCSYSPDGLRLLSAGRDAQVKLWRPGDYAEIRNLAGEEPANDEVLSARFSADGRRIVTASRDRSARLWDSANLKQLQEYREGHDFLASAAKFYADGDRLATAAADSTVRLWNVATGAEISRLDGTGFTYALDVSRDGVLIGTGGEDNVALIWDAQTRTRLAELRGHEASVSAVSFAPSGAWFATGDVRGVCRLWKYDADKQTWVASQTLRGHSRRITAIRFAEELQRLVTSSDDNTCGQWDLATGEEIAAGILKHPDCVGDVVLTDDGRQALTCCTDGKLRLWSLADGKLIRSTQSSPADFGLTSIDLSPDGRTAAVVCPLERTIRLWDLSEGREIHRPGARTERGAWLQSTSRGRLIWAARFAPDGRRLLVIGGNDAQLYDLNTGAPVLAFSPHGVVASADVSPDGARVVTGSWDRSIKIWDAARGQVLHKIEEAHRGYINSVCISPDGERILTASDDGTARLWMLADGRPLEPVFQSHGKHIYYAGFSPDGREILTAGSDHTAKLCDPKTGAVRTSLAGHKWPVRSAAFSADGRFVITGSDDNTAIVWNAVTGDRIQTLAGHTAALTCVALSRDGSRALTGSEDYAVKLWDAQTGKEILTLADHTDAITSVSFSPTGDAVLSSGRDGRTLLWPAVSPSKSAESAPLAQQ